MWLYMMKLATVMVLKCGSEVGKREGHCRLQDAVISRNEVGCRMQLYHGMNKGKEL